MNHRKSYPSIQDAMQSKVYLAAPGATVETDCRVCGGIHVSLPRKAPAPRKAPSYTGPSETVRKLVLERDDYRCVCCGLSVIGQQYSLQHRLRRSQGGDSTPVNLVTVLGTGTTGHHARIDSRRDPHDEARGYTVRSWDDPALVPVMIMSAAGAGALVWLTPEGTYSTEPPAVAA